MQSRGSDGRYLPNTREIDGELHKCCYGPGHDEPTWLPATEKYFYIGKSGRYKGKLMSRCRLCANWKKLKSPGVQGLVPISKVRPFFIEGVHRVGKMEFARRVGMSHNGLRNILNSNGQRHVQKAVARRAMLEVISMRRKNEVRHRDSIQHGSLARGRQEKEVKIKQDLYVPHGDEDSEWKRRDRRVMSAEEIEENRRKDRERRRKQREAKRVNRAA